MSKGCQNELSVWPIQVPKPIKNLLKPVLTEQSERTKSARIVAVKLFLALQQLSFVPYLEGLTQQQLLVASG